MRECFIKCLWGDDLIDLREEHKREVSLCRQKPFQPEPSVFVAFGLENEQIARDAGWPNVLRVSDEPVVNLTGAADRNAVDWYGCLPYGIHMYFHKFLAIKAVLKAGYTDVVFLDMESEMIRTLPEDFWQVLRAGQPLQAPLASYVRMKCYFWRDKDVRKVPGAIAIYCRDTAVLDRCMEVAKANPRWSEEQAMAFVIDERMGGWKGVEGYRDAGFQFPYFEQYAKMCLPPLVPVFGSRALKGWSPMKRKGQEAWKKYLEERRASDAG